MFTFAKFETLGTFRAYLAPDCLERLPQISPKSFKVTQKHLKSKRKQLGMSALILVLDGDIQCSEGSTLAQAF